MIIDTKESLKIPMKSQSKAFIDTSKENLFRQSALMRILLGTFTTTTISIFYALAHARYRKFELNFVKNWVKGSFTFSLMFYTGNEVLFSITNFYKIYTNFWLNYTVLAYFLSKIHYRFLIRNHMMKWYTAIKYSHKCFLLFLVLNLTIELFIYLTKEIYLFDEKDVFDILKEKYTDKFSEDPNFDMTYKEIEDNFMKTFHIINSKEKIKKIKEHISKKNQEKSKNLEAYIDNKSMLNFKLNTVNLYEMYKNKEI